MVCVGVQSIRGCYHHQGYEFLPSANGEFCRICVDPCPSVAENGYGTACCGATFAEYGIGGPADGGQIVTIDCTGAGLARDADQRAAIERTLK